MDDVYLLNNPFTFQAMEKHSAYCAMMRLGLRVPETWLMPHKVPPDEPALRSPTAERYNAAVRPRGDRPSDRLPALHEAVRRRPVGRRLARRGLPRSCAPRYDESGRADDAPAGGARGLRRVRALALDRRRDDGMWFDPTRPMHDRYHVRHDFLSPARSATRSSRSRRLVNAFFRWEFNSCETIVKDGVAYPIDYANASPDVALTSLHYYFPWAITALVRWVGVLRLHAAARCAINQNSRDYFEIGDRDDLGLRGEARRATGPLADDYFQVDAYREFCDRHLAHLDELAHEWFTSPAFDDGARARRWSRRSPSTSRSTSSPTTAGCSPPGRATTLDLVTGPRHTRRAATCGHCGSRS